MKDSVDLIKRGGNRFAIAYVPLNEFGFWIDPGRFGRVDGCSVLDCPEHEPANLRERADP